ncbi:MAG: amino acid ABC transporter permease, partial [Mesorhizobium sp.]
MQEHDLSFVRVEMALAQSAPPSERGLGAWIRKNLIASTGDTILTIIGIVLVAMILPQVISWAFINAQWTGTDRTVCATVAQGGIQPEGWSGACWAFVNAKFGQFMFGRYPIDERWRPILVAILFVALLVPLLIPKVPRKGLNAILLFGALPVVAFILLVGGMFGLPLVETSLWGGLLVTLSLSFVGIAVSLPVGIVLALGRRSKMPIVKMLCIIFIET